MESLTQAATLFERSGTMRDSGNLILCRVAQGDFSAARGLASAFVDSSPTRAQARELSDDLSELAGIPGIDQDLVADLRRTVAHALREP